MSVSDTLATLSLIDAGLQCTNQYMTDKKENPEQAVGNLFSNTLGAFARIGMADHRARHGDYFGYTLNSFFPYTSPQSNFQAMATQYMMSPWAGGYMGGYMPMMGGGYWGMPFFGGLGFGGGHHHHHCGGPSFTSINIRC